MMKRVYLGLGTNLGDREKNLQIALEKIHENIGSVIVSSSLYETDPWGFTSENKFLNMAAEVKTELTPSGILGRILMIETLMGRTREGKGYKSRIIDIDILFYDSRIINKNVLQVPHPGITDRRFVLEPLCEIAPDLIHPVLKKNIRELLEECKDTTVVKKL
jgi:2-amino-4-hydroxy-6-hydroxymethyldihydropteridine diphosphokinase